MFPAHLELHCGPVSAVDLALYAAASGDHNPLHLDDAIARKAGFAQPVVHGMLTMAYVARLFTQAFGAGSLLSLNTRFTGAALRGDTLVLKADINESDDVTALYRVRVENGAAGEIASGTARVRLPASAGQPLP